MRGRARSVPVSPQDVVVVARSCRLLSRLRPRRYGVCAPSVTCVSSGSRAPSAGGLRAAAYLLCVLCRHAPRRRRRRRMRLQRERAPQRSAAAAFIFRAGRHRRTSGRQRRPRVARGSAVGTEGPHRAQRPSVHACEGAVRRPATSSSSGDARQTADACASEHGGSLRRLIHGLLGCVGRIASVYYTQRAQYRRKPGLRGTETIK